MRSVTHFRAWAGRRWRADWPHWLARQASASPTEPSDAARVRWLLLHPPTEAVMADDPEAVVRWVRDWQRQELADGIEVRWVIRAWRDYGTQRLPERATGSPAALAELAGEADTWQRALDAATQVQAAWPDVDFTAPFTAAARQLAALPEPDVVRLLAVLAWIAAHPASGLWERELPVVGVHTKWLEQHRWLVEQLSHAITGLPGTGLHRPAVRFRVRLLDTSLWSGANDFTATLEELRLLTLTPRRVLVCENATTVGTLPALPATVAVHGMGFAAPVLTEVAWIRDADLWYWGDLDTYGFQILGQLRAAAPSVRSVLMDADTLVSNEQLCVDETRPFRGEIGHLTAGELEALALVRIGDRRLEQERIPRQAVHAALEAAFMDARAQGHW